MSLNAFCETCGAQMPSSGPPRRRNGQIACKSCVVDPLRIRPRRTGTKGRTEQTKHLTRALLESHAALLESEDFAALADRPKTWGECRERTGPCPWVACRHHLFLDVTPSGGLKLNFPDLEPEELEHPCALRIAALGGVTLEGVGARMNLTRERIRQVEVRALYQLKRMVGT